MEECVEVPLSSPKIPHYLLGTFNSDLRDENPATYRRIAVTAPKRYDVTEDSNFDTAVTLKYNLFCPFI